MASRVKRLGFFTINGFIFFIFVLHLAIVSQVGLPLFLDVNDVNAEGTIVSKIYYYGTFLSGAFVGVTTWPRFAVAKYKTNILAMLPFVLICVASLSYTPDLIATRTNIVRLVAAVFSISGFCRLYGPAVTFRAVATVFCLVNIASFVAALTIPSIGVHSLSDNVQAIHAGNWRGVTGHKNALGRVAAISALMLLFYPKLISDNRFVTWALVAACLLNLFNSQSQTSIAGFIVCIIAYFMFIGFRQNIFSLTAKIVGGAVAAAIVVYSLPFWLELFGRDATFTGRSEIWQFAWSTILDRPFLGYGYGAGEHYFRLQAMNELFRSAVDPHQANFLVMIDVGLIGWACLMFSVFVALWKAMSSNRSVDEADWKANSAFALCLCFNVFAGMSETAPFDISANVGVLTFASIISISKLISYERSSVDKSHKIIL